MYYGKTALVKDIKGALSILRWTKEVALNAVRAVVQEGIGRKVRISVEISWENHPADPK